jgi:hypothetical protein
MKYCCFENIHEEVGTLTFFLLSFVQYDLLVLVLIFAFHSN